LLRRGSGGTVTLFSEWGRGVPHAEGGGATPLILYSPATYTSDVNSMGNKGIGGAGKGGGYPSCAERGGGCLELREGDTPPFPFFHGLKVGGYRSDPPPGILQFWWHIQKSHGLPEMLRYRKPVFVIIMRWRFRGRGRALTC